MWQRKTAKNIILENFCFLMSLGGDLEKGKRGHNEPKVIFLLIKTYFSEYLRPERSPAARCCACLIVCVCDELGCVDCLRSSVIETILTIFRCWIAWMSVETHKVTTILSSLHSIAMVSAATIWSHRTTISTWQMETRLLVTLIS